MGTVGMIDSTDYLLCLGHRFTRFEQYMAMTKLKQFQNHHFSLLINTASHDWIGLCWLLNLGCEGGSGGTTGRSWHRVKMPMILFLSQFWILSQGFATSGNLYSARSGVTKITQSLEPEIVEYAVSAIARCWMKQKFGIVWWVLKRE